MPVKSLNDIPTLTIESIKDIMGNIYTKRIKLPDKSPQLSRKYLDLEDGTYYSIYEICELIDKLVKNKKTIKLDNKEFKTTEELQKYLETETNNPYKTWTEKQNVLSPMKNSPRKRKRRSIRSEGETGTELIR